MCSLVSRGSRLADLHALFLSLVCASKQLLHSCDGLEHDSLVQSDYVLTLVWTKAESIPSCVGRLHNTHQSF